MTERLDRISSYRCMIQVREHLFEEEENEWEDIAGWRHGDFATWREEATVYSLLVQGSLRLADLLLMQSPLPEDVATHVLPSGEDVFSVLHRLFLKPPGVKVFFRSHSLSLHVYIKTPSGSVILPKVKEGTFFSWGFASRIANAGRFEDAPPLHIHSFSEEA